MRLMSDKRQLEIVEAVKVASDSVGTGATPTDALVKAARDISANEHELQRMVEAYNTSATLAHMRTSQEKSASFPLADFEGAQKALFPSGDKAKAVTPVKQARAQEIPDLRMTKVACFYGDLGQKYQVVRGEHKDSTGTLVACETDETEEQSLDGKTVVTKRTDIAKASLKIGDKVVEFSAPDTELRREYGSGDLMAATEAKSASEKVAYDGMDFYGRPGDRYEITQGERKGDEGVLKSFKRVRKETRRLEGNTTTNSRTVTCDVVVTVGGTDVSVKPENLKRVYESKMASAREDILKDYVGWAMTSGSRVPTGVVTPEDVAADTRYQAYKAAKAEKTAGAREEPMGPPRDLTSLQNHALRQCEHWKKVAREHRLVAEEHQGIANNAMSKLAEIFRRANRPDWQRFEGEVLAVHGKEAAVYMDEIWKAGNLKSVRCTRAEGPIKVAYIDDRTELHKLFEVLKVACEIAAESKALEKEAMDNHETDREAVLQHMKEAAQFVMPMNNPLLLAANLAGAFDNTMAPAAPAKASLNPNVGLESELNKARLQAAVREMMTNDDVIAQHAGQDPARVVQIVEQLAKVHPKILDMPSVMQSGVRKALELGSIEPFELKQLQSLGNPHAPEPQKA